MKMADKKIELGEDMKGTCPNCFGRGRKLHLEYSGDNEAMCMVCSRLFKIDDNGKILKDQNTKKEVKNGNNNQ